MVEYSQPWDGTTLGDATRAPYSDNEWDDMYTGVFSSSGNRGVLMGYSSKLKVTNAGGGSVSVAAGAALVMGKFFENTAAKQLDFAVNGTHLVVARCCWGTVGNCGNPTFSGSGETSGPHKIRLCTKENTAILTKTDGVCYEIPLATVVRAGGAISSITDMRYPVAPFRAFDWVPAQVGIEEGTPDVQVPVTFVDIDGNYGHGQPGIEMADAKFTHAIGNHIVRAGNSFVELAVLVMSPDATGDAMVRCAYQSCACATALTTAEWCNQKLINIPAADTLYCFPFCNCAAVVLGAGHYLKLYFRRDGTDVGDTLAGDLVVLGWILNSRAY